jgi:hypothetical protein
LIIILLFRIILLSRLKKEIKKKEIKISVPPFLSLFFPERKLQKQKAKKKVKANKK